MRRLWLVFVLAMLLIPASAFAATFNPTPIPYSAPNFANPLRGLYTWRHLNLAPQPEPSLDAYDRFEWRDLEPAKDSYDFGDIDTEIATARSRGQKFGFNVRSMLGYNNNSQIYMPDYMKAYGWYADSNGDGTRDTYIPDFNHPYYLDRARKLVQALGNKYDGSRDIVWVEIGMLGQWGEWTIKSGIDYSSAPSGIIRPTEATKQAIIDMFVAAFPRTQLISTAFSYSNLNALLYAFGKPTIIPIGWRVNCLGRGDYFNQFTNRPSDWDKIKDRWKIAPAIAEFCYISPGDSSTNFTYALEQVSTYHISAVGNGNADPYSTFSSSDQQKFLEIAKRAGYRYILNSVTLPGSIQPGSAFTIETSWANEGSAPAYEPWEIHFVFTPESSNGTPFSLKSSRIALKSVLPGTAISFIDTVVPPHIPAGKYYLDLVVKDPRGWRLPMKLAIAGAQTNGGYRIGPVIVGTSATPTQTKTPTPLLKAGDLDKDGDVDIFDYNLLINHFNTTNCTYNVIGSCLIDIFDYNTLVQNFG